MNKYDYVKLQTEDEYHNQKGLIIGVFKDFIIIQLVLYPYAEIRVNFDRFNKIKVLK